MYNFKLGINAKSFLFNVNNSALCNIAVAAICASGNFNLCDKQYLLIKSTDNVEFVE